MSTEQERADFEAWAEKRGVWPRLTHQEIFSAGYQAGRAALQSQDREEFCEWHNDPETDNSWDTGCRQLFEIYDGTPSENRMSFCCYCGKPIQESIDRARRDEGGGE